MEAGEAVPTPRHFWMVAIFGLAWNWGIGLDYLLINIRDPAYLSWRSAGAETMQLLDSMPLWVMAAWAIQVGGGMAGSLLLLRRFRSCVWFFTLALLGLAMQYWYVAVIGLPGEMTRAGPIGVALATCTVAVLLMLYSIRMRRQGVLGGSLVELLRRLAY